ncbi:MAG: flagellar motor switch protein FliM [Gammaproteobacteria bacterium]|jgi:flagellar motor switch protein FliM|nr:flagellar motor switch protein FliM [Gammaproteobacteria bacterium]
MAISNEEVEALLENSSDGNDAGAAVRPYDFTAQRINRTQLPLLEAINRSFADRAAVSLSGLLGRSATLQYDSMEAVKAADLQVSLPMPASIAVVRLKPLNGFAFISVEPALLLTLLDGFFGGTGRPNTDSQAAAAPAAQRFMALMLRSFAADVTAAWSPVAPLELELVKQETNPRLVQLGSPQESVIVAKFTVEFAARSGRIDWLLPEALLAPHREALSGETGAVPVRKQEAWAPTLTNALQDAQLDTRAVLAEAQISLRELVSLNAGDIIPIEAPQQVTLLAGEVPLYQGRFGISQGRNALKIVSGVSR